jgi:hypothetical protein
MVKISILIFEFIIKSTLFQIYYLNEEKLINVRNLYYFSFEWA